MDCCRLYLSVFFRRDILAKYISGFAVFFFFFFLHADIFKIKMAPDDEYLKHVAGRLDIMSAGTDQDGMIELTVNASENDISLLGMFADVEKMDENIQIVPDYDDLDGIYTRIDNLEKASGGRAEVFVIGSSIENREIKAVRISKSNSDADLPEILLTGMHHAREWISYEVPLSIAEFIVENMDSNQYVSDILEKSVIWVVPVLNPDGFVYSCDVDRYWRYNRRVHPDMTEGVDLNRNYDSSWMQVEYVNGTGPFSEPETVAIKNLIENSFEKPFADGIKSLDGLITYHSFGQMILYPPGTTLEHAEKYEYYKELASKMAELTFSECGSIYLVMQTAELYYTFGEMTEWFMNTHNGAPSFTIELRPPSNGVNDFILPARQIADTVKENIVPAMYLINYIITGETAINMDSNKNGINDVIENTGYDYKCDRSDLELPDYGEYSDTDNGGEEPDDTSVSEDAKNDNSDTGESENNDVDSVTSASKRSSGCSFILGD